MQMGKTGIKLHLLWLCAEAPVLGRQQRSSVAALLTPRLDGASHVVRGAVSVLLLLHHCSPPQQPEELPVKATVVCVSCAGFGPRTQFTLHGNPVPGF
ncbi:unnamed protein product [Pleuronectes platessa]|uniref:Secreted protein n=1 Tax=Pleuronectes platessa TaxID=8262 RepID=A0A9N7YKN4_PLEPL|nr:unnamed protein product [Pleuronectes platessa]